MSNHDDAPHPADAQQSTAVATLQTDRMAVSKMNEASTSVLGERARAEIQARTIVAMNRPRNIDNFRVKILESCRRPRFAEAAMYSKPIGGKEVVGLSIRFAEEAARYFSNLDINAFPISEDDERRLFEAVSVDLETNTRFATPVIVSKTVWRLNTKGERPLRSKQNARGQTTYLIAADDDSLLVMQSNMLAKAQREVILKQIPADIREECVEQIIATLADKDAKDPDGEKKRIVDAFFAVGVMADQLAAYLGHALTALTPAEMQQLRRVYRGIKEEGATWAEVMESKGKPASTTDASASETGEQPKGAAAALKAKLGTEKAVPNNSAT